MKEIKVINDFSGGINNRDSVERLKENELADMENVRVKADGSIERRKGYEKYFTGEEGGWGKERIQNIYQYVEINGEKVLIVIAGGNVYKYDRRSGKWEKINKEVEFSKEGKHGIAVYYGDLIIADKEKGTYIYKNEIIYAEELYIGVSGNKIKFYDKEGNHKEELDITISGDTDEQIGSNLYKNLLEVDLFGVYSYKGKIYLLDKHPNGERIIRLNEVFEYEDEIDRSRLDENGIENPEKIFYDYNPNVVIIKDDYLYCLKEKEKIIKVRYDNFVSIEVKEAKENEGKFITVIRDRIGYYIGKGRGKVERIDSGYKLYLPWKINGCNYGWSGWHGDIGRGDSGEGVLNVRVYVNNIEKIHYWIRCKYGKRFWSGERWFEFSTGYTKKDTGKVFDGWIKVKIEKKRESKGWFKFTNFVVKIDTNFGRIEIPIGDQYFGNSEHAWFNREYIIYVDKIKDTGGGWSANIHSLIPDEWKVIILNNEEFTEKEYVYLYTRHNIEWIGEDEAKIYVKYQNEDKNLWAYRKNNSKRLDYFGSLYNFSGEIKIIQKGDEDKIYVVDGGGRVKIYKNGSVINNIEIGETIPVGTGVGMKWSKFFKPINSPYRPAVRVIKGGTDERSGKYAQYFVVYQFDGNILSAPSNRTDTVKFTDGYQYAKLNIYIPQYFLDREDLESINIYRLEIEEDKFDIQANENFEMIGNISGEEITGNYVEFIDDNKSGTGRYTEVENPFLFEIAEIHLNRLVLAGHKKNKSIILYSDVDVIEDIPLANFREINKDDGDYITGICSTGGYLYVFKNKNIYAIAGDVAEGGLIHIAGNIGCISKGSICSIGDRIFFMSRDGIYMLGGTQVVKISEKIEKYFNKDYKESINMKEAEKIRGVIDKERGEIEWIVPAGESKENNLSLVYNYNLGCWYVFKYKDSISEVRVIEDEDGKFIKLFGSTEGILFKGERGDTDDGEKINWMILTPAYTSGTGGYEKLYKKIIFVFSARESFKVDYTVDLIKWMKDVVIPYNEGIKNYMVRVFNGKGRLIQIRLTGTDYTEGIKLREIILEYLRLKGTGLRR